MILEAIAVAPRDPSQKLKSQSKAPFLTVNIERSFCERVSFARISERNPMQTIASFRRVTPGILASAALP
ncbi:hypothetical protein HED50_23865 [Ochrobactrum oryzae]|nr:hypothetical protein [Brucella oryzae]